MNTTRTFVAVTMAPAVIERAGALVEILRGSHADVKWVEPHNMHLTLKFLGDVREADLAEVCQTVTAATAGLAPFPVTCRGAGAFPDAGRPRTIWLGFEQGVQALQTLQAAIEKPLNALGFPREGRAFHPHLTLGRVRGGGPALRELSRRIREHAAYDAGSAEAAEVVVYASYLSRTGPTYEALARTMLAG